MTERLSNLIRPALLAAFAVMFASPIVLLSLWLGLGWAIVAALIVFAAAYRLAPASMEGGLTLLLIGIVLAVGVIIAMGIDIWGRLT